MPKTMNLLHQRLPIVATVLALLWTISLPQAAAQDGIRLPDNPQFKVDPFWPQLLPNNWTLGELAGITVDAQDNIWAIQRPKTLFLWERAAAENPPIAICCVPAPPVIQFDPSGKVLRAWGGPGQGYEWPSTEHGITIDHKGNVWVAGNGKNDGMVLKFAADGKFLMQIGHAGPSKGSGDTTQLAGAAGIAVDAATNEVFISDGYVNNRVIVFDADSGKFKRMWGAYGKPPTDEVLSAYDANAPPDKQFRIAHCIKIARDGLIYVCDFGNNRFQVFKKDGSFVSEHIYLKDTRTDRGPGSVADVYFWPDAQQSAMLVADTANSLIRVVRRSNGQVLSTYGRFGNYAGQLNRLHQLAIDSKGTVYAAEAAGKRIQKFTISAGQPAK